MKRNTQHTHLRIYQSNARKFSSLDQTIASKRIDATVIVVSLTGLFSAFVFLFTMS